MRYRIGFLLAALGAVGLVASFGASLTGAALARDGTLPGATDFSAQTKFGHGQNRTFVPRASAPRFTPQRFTAPRFTPHVTPRFTPQVTPRRFVVPRTTTPRFIAPRLVTPRLVTPRIITVPRTTTRRLATPGLKTPRLTTPRVLTKRANGPRIGKFMRGSIVLAGRRVNLLRGARFVNWHGRYRRLRAIGLLAPFTFDAITYYPYAYVPVEAPLCSGYTDDGCELRWQDVQTEDGDVIPQCVAFCPQQ